MTDLWDPVRRTEICASCHIGNSKRKESHHACDVRRRASAVAELRAGDVQRFSAEALAVSSREDQGPARPAAAVRRVESRAAELVAVSGPVVLRESMRLFAEQSEGKRRRSGRAARWPDFARYDCRALSSRAQVRVRKTFPRDEPFAPGRPGEPKWVHALARIGITGLTATTERCGEGTCALRVARQELREAMSAEPFGSGGRVIRGGR